MTGKDNKLGVKPMPHTLSFYQRKIEDFYDDLAAVFKTLGSTAYFEGLKEDVENPDLLVFEESIFYDPNDDSAEEFLGEMEKKGYEILMNFQEPDVVNGNVIVKIEKKWFAFGQCRKTEPGGAHVETIWPLKYVLMNIQEMETTPRQAISMRKQS